VGDAVDHNGAGAWYGFALVRPLAVSISLDLHPAI